MTGELSEVLAAAERPIPATRPCVHCFRRTPADHHRRPVCPLCRLVEEALNGGTSPKVQPAIGVARPPGLRPAWTPDEDRVVAQCRTAAEAHGRLPWRSKTACLYRRKTLRRAGRVQPFNHREWSPDEDAIVAAAESTGDCRAAAARLRRTITAVWRRRNELRRAGTAVTRLRKGRPPTLGRCALQ